MVFQCINIRQVPWEVLKTAASGLGFQHLPRDLANVNAWKTMSDSYIEVSGYAPYQPKAQLNIVPADGDVVVTTDNKAGIYRTDRSKKNKWIHYGEFRNKFQMIHRQEKHKIQNTKALKRC